MIRPAAVHVRPAVHFRQPPRTAALQAYRTGEKIKEKAFSSEFTLLHLQQQKTYKSDFAFLHLWVAFFVNLYSEVSIFDIEIIFFPSRRKKTEDVLLFVFRSN